MTKFFARTFLLASLLIVSATQARADVYAGAMLGLAVPGSGNDGISSRFGYGFDLGYKPLPTFGIGAYYLRNSGEIDNTNIDGSIAYYGGEALFFVPLTGLHFGARVGTSTFKVSQGAVSIEDDRFALGPVVGWDTSFLVLPVAFGLEYTPMFAPKSDGQASNTMHNVLATIRLSL